MRAGWRGAATLHTQHNTHRTLCNTYTHDTVHFMPPTLQTIITPSRASKQGEMSRLAPLVTCHGALHITHITHGLVCGVCDVLCVVKGNMSGVSSRDSHMCPPHCTGAGPSLLPQSTIMFLSLTRHYTRLIVVLVSDRRQSYLLTSLCQMFQSIIKRQNVQNKSIQTCLYRETIFQMSI